MRNVLLINPQNNNDIVYFPLGIGYLAGACHAAGIEVACLDLNVSRISDHEIINRLVAGQVKVVGISGFATQLKHTVHIANLIKSRLEDVVVIIGGVQVHGCEEFIMRQSQADIVFMGEGEEAFPELLDALFAGKDISALPAILYRHHGEIRRNPGYHLVGNLDSIPFPKYDLFDVEFYVRNNYHNAPNRRTIDFICSRGCPFVCNYCINSRKPVRMRYRSTENIVAEIRFLKNTYGINDFSFCDEIFVVDKRKAFEICEAVRSENITWVTSGRADLLDEGLVVAMKEAGCRMLLIGFESGSDTILRAMNKKADVEGYARSIAVLRQSGMRFYANFMTGMPEETLQTLQETEDFCKKNRLIYGSPFVTPFPGTELYDAVRGTISDEQAYLFSLTEINFTKEPLINLTGIPTDVLVRKRNEIVVNTMAHLLKEKLVLVPEVLLKGACRIYLLLFNSKIKPVASAIRFCNKLIYKAFS